MYFKSFGGKYAKKFVTKIACQAKIKSGNEKTILVFYNLTYQIAKCKTPQTIWEEVIPPVTIPIVEFVLEDNVYMSLN